MKISPRARRVARKLEVDWSSVTGSGITGRIRERDIRAAAEARQSIANTQQISLVAFGSAPVTLMMDIDATKLYELRQTWQNNPYVAGQVIPTTIDIVIKLVSRALAEFPIMNSRLEGNQIIYYKAIHIGFTLEVESGQVIAVIHNTRDKGLITIARETAALVEQASLGKLALDEMNGATFTISDLGMYDVVAFTPTLNSPQCAVLGIGQVAARVVAGEESRMTAIRRMVTLSLTFDHRIVDGVPAARFLKRIKDLVEGPEYWLLA